MRLLYLSALVMLLAGCTVADFTAKPTSSEMATNGVLVYALEEAPKSVGWLQPIVDGQVVAEIGNDVQYVVLSPGEHTLDGFQHAENLGNNMTYTTTYSTQRKFIIKKGEATSLGVGMLEVHLDNRYRYLWVNGQKIITDHILHEYPNLLAGGKGFNLAPGRYLSPRELAEYRRYVVQRRTALALGSHPELVGGPLGALAWLKWSRYAKSPQYEFVDTNTLADLSSCAVSDRGGACLLDEKTVFVTEQRKGKRYALPKGANWTDVLSRHGSELVALNGSFALAMSEDGGKTWTADLHHVIHKSADYGHVRGRHGVYLYSTSSDHTVLYIADGSSKVDDLSAGWSLGIYQGLVVTPKGLYYGPEYTDIENADLLFRQAGAKSWTTYAIPESNCKDLKSIGQDKLEVSCGTDVLRSNDGGKDWVKLAKH